MSTAELLYPPTHAVTNQVQPLEDYNVFTGNQALRDALKFNAPDLDTAPSLQPWAKSWVRREYQTHARLANVYTPGAARHDRFGHRVDKVEFHPSYHALMALAAESGLHGTPWQGRAVRPHQARRRLSRCSPRWSRPSCAPSP